MKVDMDGHEETCRRSEVMRLWWPALVLVILGILSMGGMAVYQIRRGNELGDLTKLDNSLGIFNDRIIYIHGRLLEDSLKMVQVDSGQIIARIDSALSLEKKLAERLFVGHPGLDLPAVFASSARTDGLHDLLQHMRDDYLRLTSISPNDTTYGAVAKSVHERADEVLMAVTSLRHRLLDHTEADLHKYHDMHTFITLLWVLAMVVALLGLIYSAHRSLALTSALLSSERNFRLLFEDAPLAYQSLDGEGRILRVNRAWLDLTGYEMQEVIGKKFTSFLSPESAESFMSEFETFKQNGELHGRVVTLVKADQTPVEVSTDGRIASDSEGEFARTHCILHDVTERIRSENAVRTERQRLFDVLEMLPGFVYLQKADYTITFANREFRRLFGDPKGHVCYSLLRGRDHPCDDCSTVDAMQTGASTVNKWDSNGRTYRVSGFPFVESDGSRLILKLGVDITDLADKERLIQEHKEKYEQLYNNALAGLFRTRVDDGMVIDCNDRFAEMFGFSNSKEMIGRSVCDYYAEPETRRKLVTMLHEKKHVHDFEAQLLPPHGKTVWVLNSVRLSPDGRFIDGVMADITDRKRTQAALRATEERMKLLAAGVEQSAGTVCITDPHGTIQYVNPAFEKLTGYSALEVYGKPASVLRSGKHSREFYKDLWTAITAGRNWSGNIQNKKKNGELYWERRVITPVVDRDGKVTNYVAIGEDITSETVAQQKLMEADKMAAVGMLAAGVAHEFKNYLGGIIGNASFALDELEESDNMTLAKETLQGIIEMGERANEVAMSLLTYSKARPLEYSCQDLRTVIRNTVALVDKELRKRSIELVTYLEDAPEVEVSAGKIQQLLMNLIINAEQAIPSQGVITIALFNDQSRIRLAVGDSGAGIAEENIFRIFDPFFSTKGVWGKDGIVGTGIGLSICRNIAREHQGDLTVESVVGAGTTFTLTLPVSHDQAPAEVVTELGERPRRMLVFSITNDILSHYFKDACAHDIGMLTVNSFDQVTENVRSTTDIVICDARFTGMMELTALAEALRHRGVPYLVVNAGGRDYRLAEMYQHSLVTFSDLPEFDKLEKYVFASEEPARC